jgi:hypothetical protein
VSWIDRSHHLFLILQGLASAQHGCSSLLPVSGQSLTRASYLPLLQIGGNLGKTAPDRPNTQPCNHALVTVLRGRIDSHSAMYIEAVPNRTSPPAILLRASFRHEGKVCKRTLCNLSGWSPAHVEGLRGVLKGAPSSHPGTTPSPSPAACPTATSPLPSARRARSVSTASSARPVIAAATSFWPCWPVASLTPFPSSPPPGRCHLPRHPQASAKCSALARSMTPNSMPRWTGCCSARPPSRPRWPNVIAKRPLGALRRLVELHRGKLLSAGQTWLQP